MLSLVKMNVLERAGKGGTDLLIDHLTGYRTAAEVATALRDLGFQTTNSNIRKLLQRYRDEYDAKPIKVGTAILTHREISHRLQELRSDAREAFSQDPIDVISKNIYELEKLKTDTLNFRDYGSVLDLQSKLATQLAKMVPPEIVKIDINMLLSRNDLGVNFIIQMDSKYPELGLKEAFLEFVQANSDDI